LKDFAKNGSAIFLHMDNHKVHYPLNFFNSFKISDDEERNRRPVPASFR